MVTLGAVLWMPVRCMASEKIAEITTMEGRVDILRGGKLPSEKAAIGAELFVGDFVRTKSRSSAELLFVDGNRVSIKERSRVDIQTYALDQDQRTLNLSRGKVEAVVVPKKTADKRERPKRFEIHTPNAVAGIRGTTLVVSFQDSTTAILVKALHGGRAVYSLSKFHPEQLFEIPEGGMMWVSNNNLPTPIPPSSSLEYKTLASALKGNLSAKDLLVLVDVVRSGLDALSVPLLTESFPELIKPSFEVGTVELTGATEALDVSMTSHFLALTPDSAPVEWWSDDVLINWSSAIAPFNPEGVIVGLFGDTPAGFALADFTVEDWNTTSGTWVASITNGQGELPNGTTFSFIGGATGTGATGLPAGAVTGEGFGLANLVFIP